MKVNIKALELIEKGLSSKTVGKLTESQINVLHSKLVGEQVTEVPGKKTYKVGPAGGKVGNLNITQDPSTKEVMVTATESELDEDADLDDSAEKDSGFDPYAGNSVGNDDGPSSDDGFGGGRDGMGMMEEKKKSKKDENNPWAICTSQLGKEFGTRERHLWSAKENNKYERCVKDVKKSLKEQKNPVSLFLENEIIKIVERNLPPKITKKELMNYLNEAGTETAPTRTKPTTKPGTRPNHPGKNPNPGTNPAPKANRPSPEESKDKIMDVIMQILEK
jgi:hypothetical protein